MIEEIIAGGQTGVDRAALDVAIKHNMKHSGWCPKNRRAEDGMIPNLYNLRETESENYSERTKLNILDSDGTLILIKTEFSQLKNGTVLTLQEAREQNKPYLIINMLEKINVDDIVEWLEMNDIKRLNLAGPRESQCPRIYNAAWEFLDNLLTKICPTPR